MGNAKKQTGPYVSELDFSQTFETVDWSRARYADRASAESPPVWGQRHSSGLLKGRRAFS